MEYLVPIENCRHVDLGYDTYRVREVLKSWIIENGPVATNMYVTDLFRVWGDIFHNLHFYVPYIDAVDNIYNHCVVIVGWQDHPLIRRGGYWICKNSWGTNWGDNGFFSIEYGSLNVASEIIWVDYDPESYDWPPVENDSSVIQEFE
jgi:C1A family cysteine protease